MSQEEASTSAQKSAAKSALEQHLAAMKREGKETSERAAKRLKWTYREGVYMVIFQLVIVVMMGGIHGAAARPLGPASGSKLIDKEGALSFSLNTITESVGETLGGIPLHLELAWAYDLVLIIGMILVAFLIKQTRVRRRCFTMVIVITMTVLTWLIVSDLPMLSNLRL